MDTRKKKGRRKRTKKKSEINFKIIKTVLAYVAEGIYLFVINRKKSYFILYIYCLVLYHLLLKFDDEVTKRRWYYLRTIPLPSTPGEPLLSVLDLRAYETYFHMYLFYIPPPPPSF